MNELNYISSFCKIKNGEVNLNGEVVFSNKESINPEEFIRAVYKHFQMNYPKFYKMDNLCKLAFVCSELLLRSNVLDNYQKKDIAIVIGNSASSLEIDKEHQRSINDKANYFPSPANFVYTLPNILIGEIAIRNKIKGENTFFIFDKFDAPFMARYIDMLLNKNKAQICIAGWVDLFENKYEAELYIVEKKTNGLNILNNEQELNKLINN